MRVERLHIDGFGVYHDAPFGPFDQALTVVTGLNEAGKSTLLRFIRAVLFGFPQRLGAEHYPPLAGGRHGGRVHIVTDAGERFTIERFHGRGTGPVTITAADGSSVDESVLPRLLGHASGSLFQSVFAFDLEELKKPAAGDDQETSNRIYSAGTGAGQLPRVLEDLNKRSRDIFAPRGQNQPVAGLLRALAETESDFNAVRSQAADYGQAVSRRGELTGDIARYQARLDANAKRQRELERYRSAQTDWHALRAAEQRIEALPDLGSFPEDPIGRLDRFEEQRLERQAIVREAADQVEPAREEAERPISDESLLGHSSEIELLRRGRGSFDSSIGDLPERVAELRNMESQLQESLRQLGPDWDESRLEHFDTSIPRLDQVEQQRQGLSQRRQAIRDREATVEREHQEHRDAVGAQEKARAQLDAVSRPPLTIEAMEQRRAALRDARRQEEDHSRARQRRVDLELQQSGAGGPGERRWALPLLLALAGAASLVVGIVVDEQQAAIVLGAVLLGAAGVAYLWLPSAKPPVSREIDAQAGQARDTEEKTRDALLAAAAALGLDQPDGGLPDRKQLDGVEADLDVAAASLAAWIALTTRAGEAGTETERRQARLAEAEAKANGAEDALRGAQEGWAEWLRAHELPDTLTPETSRDLFSRVEAARVEARRVSEMRRRAGAIQHDIDEYRTLVAPLAGAYVPDIRLDAEAAVARAADALIERFDRARTEDAQRTTARTTVTERERNLTSAQGRLRDIEGQIEDLLFLGGTNDPEEFRRRASRHLERERLEADRRERIARLRQLCSPGEELDQLREALVAMNPGEIEEELAAIESELTDLTQTRDAFVEERGGVEERLRRLGTDENASRLRADRTVYVEKLRAHAADWSKLMIARALLERARQRYEKERQPAVIRRAGSFFSTLTGGRYTRLHVPLGEQEPVVFDGSGRQKKVVQLSRGTRDQLYLALRLGLIQEFGEQEERLPVIVDEVLVNFDPDRARRAAAGFVELSQRNQVLVFTCHSWVATLFRDAAPDAGVVDLDALDTTSGLM